jgi:hypothetical protein
MKNYSLLNIQYDKQYLLEQKNNIENLDIKVADKISGYRVGHFKDKSVLDPILDLLPVRPDGAYFLINPPKKSHIDRGRTVAINFPLDVSGTFFVAKEYPSDWFSKNITEVERTVDVLNFKEKMYNYPDFESNQDQYDWNESNDTPYVLNVSVPHGVIHNRVKDRYVLSCSYTSIKYEELIKQFGNLVI